MRTRVLAARRRSLCSAARERYEQSSSMTKGVRCRSLVAAAPCRTGLSPPGMIQQIAHSNAVQKLLDNSTTHCQAQYIQTNTALASQSSSFAISMSLNSIRIADNSKSTSVMHATMRRRLSRGSESQGSCICKSTKTSTHSLRRLTRQALRRRSGSLACPALRDKECPQGTRRSLIPFH